MSLVPNRAGTYECVNKGKSIISIRNVRSSVVKNKAKKLRDKWIFLEWTE